MQVFLNQPGRQMRASLILLFGKTKPLFGKDTVRKNIAKIGCENYFSMQWKATCKN